MSYTRIYIVAGVQVSNLQLEEFLTKEGFFTTDSDEPEKEKLAEAWERYAIDKRSLTETKLFPYPCCSECTDWILGTVVHTIYRQRVICDDCKENTSCSGCLGKTAYGWYDIDKIFSQVVEIPIAKICVGCHSDQVQGGRCRVCLLELTMLTKAPKVSGGIGVVGDGLDKTVEPADYYYMIKGCAKCK